MRRFRGLPGWPAACRRNREALGAVPAADVARSGQVVPGVRAALSAVLLAAGIGKIFKIPPEDTLPPGPPSTGPDTRTTAS